MEKIGITIYGCEKDEEKIFKKISSSYGVIPTFTSSPLSEINVNLAFGNQCISVSHKSKISESLLKSLKAVGVKYISTRSIGCDHIDLKAAERIGITIKNVTYSPGGVADYTLMLMLMVIRNAKTTMRRADRYDYRLERVRGKELRDMTVGVLGTGQIGKAVIKRLRGFGCRVIACGNSKELSINYVSLNELLQNSDILTLHVPLNEKTHHMIGDEQFKLMKPGSFLINTARGGLVDTIALIKHLETGKLSGAALDVLEGEEGIFYYDNSQKPPENDFLITLQRMKNVIITPHTAYYTERALRETAEKTIKNCLDFERSMKL